MQFLHQPVQRQDVVHQSPGLGGGLHQQHHHAGQFATLEQVVRHYAASPKAALGHSELAQPGEKHADRQVIRLSEADVQDLAAFLRTLTGPVVQAK